MRQRRLTVTADQDLFGAKPIKLNPTVHPEAVPRLSRQCELILERLKQGPASNDELCRITRNHTGRLSDLRKSGYKIKCTTISHAEGRYAYTLE